MCSFKTEQKKSGEARKRQTDRAKYVISEQFSQDLCAELFRRIIDGLEKKIYFFLHAGELNSKMKDSVMKEIKDDRSSIYKNCHICCCWSLFQRFFLIIFMLIIEKSEHVWRIFRIRGSSLDALNWNNCKNYLIYCLKCYFL